MWEKCASCAGGERLLLLCMPSIFWNLYSVHRYNNSGNRDYKIIKESARKSFHIMRDSSTNVRSSLLGLNDQ